MEVAEMLWISGDIDGSLKEVDRILTTPNADNNTVNNALLLSAYIHFEQGKSHQSNEILCKVQFPTFDVCQWVVENNILVINYLLENKDIDEQKKNVPVIQGLALLLEKIQGLPSHSVALLEIHVSFNFGMAILAADPRKTNIHVPGEYDMKMTKIQQTINRVLEFSLDIQPGTGSLSRLSMMDKLKYFYESNERNKNLSDKILFPFSWLCWLLSLFWLMDYRIEEAQQLTQMLIKVIKSNSHTPLLGKNKFIFTMMVGGMYQDKTEGSKTLTTGCNLVLSYCSYLNHNKKEAMNQCDFCLNANPEFLPALLIKGLILYEDGAYSDALQPLQQLLTLSEDNSYKATALNILGCACAKLGKPHTALIKFRSSFASNKGHVEALYNVGLLYHELQNYDLEISLWQHLLKILSHSNSNETAYGREEMNVSFMAGRAARILDRVICNDHFLISTDVYSTKNSCLYNSKLNRYVVLYKIAHNCFQQKRYEEAAKYFLSLLGLIDDRPLDVQKLSLPSLIVIFHETATALCRSSRYDDTTTVCDKILLQRRALFPDELTCQTSTKRSLENLLNVENWVETKSVVGIMLCKAEALIQLQRPVEADEIYKRILTMINKKLWNICECDINESELNEQDYKKQKTDVGPKGIHKCDTETKRNIEEYEKLKGAVFNKQGVLLKSLGRMGEALLAFAQSISCHPRCVKYYYDHTSLLFDLGKNKEASQNWLNIRKLDEKREESVSTSTTAMMTDSQTKEMYLDDEDPSLYIAMDACALKNS